MVIHAEIPKIEANENVNDNDDDTDEHHILIDIVAFSFRIDVALFVSR